MTETRRTAWISLRVSPGEKKHIAEIAKATGMSLGDYLRQQIGQPRVRATKTEREKILQLARLGNNLNQIARWANTYKNGASSIKILSQLAALERELRCI